jgi:UDP-glucuronate 4-epimerase
MSGRTILVTGVAAFIGVHIALKLLAEGREAIIKGRPITLFNHGNMRRDFTSIDDVTRVISRLIGHLPPDNGAGGLPARIYNIGNNRPEELNHVVSLPEQALGRAAVKEMLPM